MSPKKKFCLCYSVKMISFLCLSFPFLSCLLHLQTDFNINPQFCSKEIAIYCQDLLKIKYNKDISGNIPLTMQEKCQVTQKTQYITHSESDMPRDKHFPLFFFIQVIFILLGVFSIGFMVAGQPCAQTLTHIHTHTHTRQDPRCPLVHVVILFFFFFFLLEFLFFSFIHGG